MLTAATWQRLLQAHTISIPLQKVLARRQRKVVEVFRVTQFAFFTPFFSVVKYYELIVELQLMKVFEMNAANRVGARKFAWGTAWSYFKASVPLEMSSKYFDKLPMIFTD